VWPNEEYAIQIQYKTILPASAHNVTWWHDDALDILLLNLTLLTLTQLILQYGIVTRLEE
jgi:hypothetical protein